MSYGRPLAIVSENATEEVLPEIGGEHAIVALKALAQPARMEIFRMVNAAPEGVAARLIAARLGGPHSVVSMHLAVLSRARLLVGQRDGDSVVYRANRPAVRGLLRYLMCRTSRDREQGWPGRP